MIHVFTRDARLRGRLALLLRELGHSAQFFESVVDSVEAASSRPRSLLIRDIAMAEEAGALQSSTKELPEVWVEAPEQLSQDSVRGRPANSEFYVLLPQQPNRAKERLRSAINQALVRGPQTLRLHRDASLRPPASVPAQARSSANFTQSRFGRGSTAQAQVSGTPRARPSVPERPLGQPAVPSPKPAAPSPPRYLIAESVAARSLLTRLRTAKNFQAALVFHGPAGAEFETAAREVNYLVNGDRETLAFIPPDDFSIERLVQMERACESSNGPRLCFLQHLEEIRPEPARHLAEIVQRLKRAPRPPLRLLTALKKGQGFLDPVAEQIVETLLTDLPRLELPPLSQRLEDIRPLALRLLSTMLEAHPFLVVREISPEALTFLEEQSGSLQFAELVGLLRNAFALASRPVLGVAELTGLLDSDHAGRHLLESAADEHCFPNAGQAG